jgi:capsid protein
VIHLFRPLRPGQIRGEPWLARALVKLNELDQYDDAELVRKKTAAMFAGFITRLSPEDNLLGEGSADANGVALAGLEPGTLQILEPGEDIKFSPRPMSAVPTRSSCASSSAPWPPRWASPTRC